MQPAPVFGKRSRAAVRQGPARAATAPAAPDHAAVFATARAEVADAPRDVAVPRSFRAALLAGLVVGCCLAGVDATRSGETLRALSGGLLSATDAPRLAPLILVLALYGGARAAATSLLLAHAVLRRVGLTGHLSYALGSAAVAVALSALAVALVQSGVIEGSLVPTHGLSIDAAAGGGAGFFYRVFAGARPADGSTPDGVSAGTFPSS